MGTQLYSTCCDAQCPEGTSSHYIVSADHVSDLDQQRFTVKEFITSNLQTATAHKIEPVQHCEDIGRLACRDIDPGSRIEFFVLFVKDGTNSCHGVLDKFGAAMGAVPTMHFPFGNDPPIKICQWATNTCLAYKGNENDQIGVIRTINRSAEIQASG